MGIYWCAIDEHAKKKIDPPEGFSIKTPGLFHPNNPFPGMVIMMNSFGYDFELINDSDWEGPFYSDEYIDITQEVYQKHLSFWQLKESNDAVD